MSEQHDEWTVVKHKRHNRPSTATAKRSTGAKAQTTARTPHSHAVALSNSCQSSDHVDQRELDKALNNIANFRQTWANSVQGRHLRGSLLARSYTISNAIVVGLGNLDPNSIRDRFRATWQLAVFLEILGVFDATHQTEDVTTSPERVRGHRKRIVAYDPAFTSFDTVLLFRLGIEVRPEAMQSCGQETLLFVPFVDAVVLLPEILKGQNPELYVGTDIELIVEKMSSPAYAQMGHISQNLVDDSLTIAREFLRHRAKLGADFDGFQELSLYGLSIYGRTNDAAAEPD